MSVATGIGASLLRTEDRRFLTGEGRYTANLIPQGALWCAFYRSPLPHARIGSIEAGRARAVGGVVDVLLPDDPDIACLAPLRTASKVKPAPGTSFLSSEKAILPPDKARYEGEILAGVIGESPSAAAAGLRALAIDLAPLPVHHALVAQATEAPVWHLAPDNRCFTWVQGDSEATGRAFDTAHRTVRVRAPQNRVTAAPLEGRAAWAEVEAETGRLVLTLGCQGVHNLQRRLSAHLGIDAEALRVICPDVGGGFGMKIFPYAEYLLVLAAAKRLGRPVAWAADRSEGFCADTGGRRTETEGALALDDTGRIVAQRFTSAADLGAYLSLYGPANPTLFGGRVFGGAYRIPVGHARVDGFYTNAAPIDAYRGAGRPEAAYYIERLMDEAGRQTGLGPFEIRRRNVLEAADLPYTNWAGTKIPEGDFAALLETAQTLCGYHDLEARRAAIKAQGRLLGFGVGLYLEIAAADGEEATLELMPGGRLRARVGTQSNGQGHETAYAQVLHSALGVPVERIEIVQGDTDRVASGGGTGGSRSLTMAGSALLAASEALIEAGRPVACRLLQCTDGQLVFDPTTGRFSAGEATVDWVSLAGAHGPSLPEPLSGHGRFKPAGNTFPAGCHVAEV
ncbi:MAG: xanthine dehydrogenase family protein, partial [Pseudomonadota bacterium]